MCVTSHMATIISAISYYITDVFAFTYLCPISCATTYTLSKCLPSFTVQLLVTVHIPATGARPVTIKQTKTFL